MKFVLKSLKNQLYEVEVGSSEDSILTLKENLCSKFSFDITCLKLLFKGIILDNNKKISDYKLTESDNIIIMNMKAKPTNSQPEETKKTEEISSINNINFTVDKSITEKIGTQPVETNQQKKDYSNEIASLMELGFTYDRSRHAIKRTKGDIGLAMEMLFNNLDVEEDVETLEGTLPKENIIQSIASICKIAGYNNKKYVRNILEGLEQSNPEVAQAIKNNQEDFDHLLKQPITEEDVKIYQMFTGKTFNQNKAENIENTIINNNPNTATINTSQNQEQNITSESLYNSAIHSNTALKQKYNLSNEEYEAVLRIKELGFGLVECIETYLACDKNEMQTISLLLETQGNQN